MVNDQPACMELDNFTIAFNPAPFGFIALALLLNTSFAPSASAQEDGWAIAKDEKFSFEYPVGWKIARTSEGNVTQIQAVDSTALHTLVVQFESGLANEPEILNQCGSIDKYLDFFYQNRYKVLDTGTGQYPYTSVTRDDFQPGFLGGKSTYVSIVHVEKYQKPISHIFYMNAVPRVGGFYLVSYGHPSEPMQVSEPFRQHFLKSITFSAPPLDKNAPCNYLGGK